MSEKIRKEISESELENVSGGYYGEQNAPNCEKCGTKTHFIVKGPYNYYDCPNCGHSVLAFICPGDDPILFSLMNKENNL